MKVVATYNIKGGVGKTATAVNIAYEAAHSGSRVLLWDLDPQGAASFFFRIKPHVEGGARRLIDSLGSLSPHIRATDHVGLDLVPADFSMRNLDLYLDTRKRPMRRIATLLEPLTDRYDIVILDCPPGITLASESVFVACDALLVPTIPTTLSMRTLDQLTSFLAGADRPLVLSFVSMVDRRKKLHRDFVAELTARADHHLPTVIASTSVIERMGVERAPVAAFAPRSQSAIAYRALWRDIADRLWP